MSLKSLGRRVLALAALCCALTPVSAASAQDAPPVTITSGAGANWGVKASFRNYVLGPIAHGAIAVADGATVNPDGTFHFPIESGSYDPVTGATVVQLAGTVHFTGHAGQLDLKLSHPRIELTAQGSSLFADVASRTSLEATEITQFPNVRVTDVDLTDKSPTVADGKTLWSDLPQVLTATGAPAFAGFYTAGTALDPISFGYDGPGGWPQVETWSLPGVPQYDKVATGTVLSGVRALGFDPVRDRVWTSANDRGSVTLLKQSDLSTVTTVAFAPDAFFNPRNVAVDRITGAAYVIDGLVQRVTEDAGTFALDTSFSDSLGGGASNALDAAPDGSIYTVKDDRLIRYRNGVKTVFTLPQPYDNVAVLEDGSIYVYGQFLTRAIGKVTLAGTTADVTDIPGTEGVNAPGFLADGSLYFVEQDYSQYPKVTRRLWFVKRTATGFTKTQVPGIATGIGGNFIAVAGDDTTVFVGNEASTGLSVIHNGVVVDTIAPDGTLSDVETSPDGDVYAIWRNGHVARLGQVGATPAFTTQPQDAAVFEGSPAGFTAVASGDPAPTITWQTRAPGTTRWVDAATGASYTITSPVAGTRVRAIATNAHGELASDVVTVTVKPPVVDPPPPGDNGTPQPGHQTPTPIAAPAPTPRAATLTAPKTAKVSPKRLASVVSLTCGSAACTITTPKTVKVKIAGRTYTAAITAPKTLAAGKKGTVRVRLTAAAYRALRGRRTTAKVKVVLTADGKQTTRTASVSLRR